MPASQTSLLTLARIVRPQGRRGEVLCELHTDFPEQFTSSESLSLTTTDGQSWPITVEQFWKPHGKNAGRIVLKISSVSSISEADLLRGASVQMPRAERVSLESSTYFVADLIGCDFYDRDRCLGKLTDVHFPADTSGRPLPDAAALFAVCTDEGAELLVPFANQFTKLIDLEKRSIHMELPIGLAELNR